MVLDLNKEVNLSDSHKEIILKEAKGIYEQGKSMEEVLGKIVVIRQCEEEGIEVEDILDPDQIKGVEYNVVAKRITEANEIDKVSDTAIEDKDPRIVRFNDKIIHWFGRDHFKSWFSRLDYAIEEQAKKITISAPTSFIRDSVRERYGSYIEKFINEIFGQVNLNYIADYNMKSS